MGFFFAFYVMFYMVKWFIILTFWMIVAAFVIAGVLLVTGGILAFLLIDFLIQFGRVLFAKRGTGQWSWLGLPLVHLSYFSKTKARPVASKAYAGARTKIKARPGPRDWTPTNPR